MKIAAKELEKAIAGLNLYVARKLDEVEVLKDDVTRELKSALSGIKLQERGVYVQASTLGSLEALLEFLRTSKIPVSGHLKINDMRKLVRKKNHHMIMYHHNFKLNLVNKVCISLLFVVFGYTYRPSRQEGHYESFHYVGT